VTWCIRYRWSTICDAPIPAKIDWVADASCADIPRWTVGIDRVIAPPLRQFKKNGKKWRDLRGILGAVRELRREPYDVAIDVHGVYKRPSLRACPGPAAAWGMPPNF
jgi:ADP-heptose:LPS heptosyltransferase